MGKKACEQPLLNEEKREGRKQKYSHGFSSAEMKTLASVAEAVFPSLSSSSDLEGNGNQPSKAVQYFLQASASESPNPDEVKKKKNSLYFFFFSFVA